MGCACNKRRRGTAYGSSRPTQTVPYDEPAQQNTPEDPIQVQFSNGEIREYPTMLEAHAAKILAGGGEIIGP